MGKFDDQRETKGAQGGYPALLGAASLVAILPSTPAIADGDITNFNVKNCSQERMFVCSFDKTAYAAQKGKGACPAALEKQFVNVDEGLARKSRGHRHEELHSEKPGCRSPWVCWAP